MVGPTAPIDPSFASTRLRLAETARRHSSKALCRPSSRSRSTPSLPPTKATPGIAAAAAPPERRPPVSVIRGCTRHALRWPASSATTPPLARPMTRSARWPRRPIGVPSGRRMAEVLWRNRPIAGWPTRSRAATRAPLLSGRGPPRPRAFGPPRARPPPRLAKIGGAGDVPIGTHLQLSVRVAQPTRTNRFRRSDATRESCRSSSRAPSRRRSSSRRETTCRHRSPRKDAALRSTVEKSRSRPPTAARPCVFSGLA